MSGMQEEQAIARAKQSATRYNAGKLEWSLVHWASLWPLVQVLMFGAKKYAPDNWKKGLNKRRILESLMRHLTALMDGEENDPESGLSHIGHIYCNAMFYVYFVLHPEKEVGYDEESSSKPTSN